MEKQAKKQKFIGFGKIFTITFCAVVIGITFTLADLFSSLITVGGFTFTNSDISIPKFTLFAICTAKTTSNATANEHSVICKNKGGAGYIYILDSSFNIIASMYENEADAQKVASNLKDSGTTAEIITITISPVSFNSSLTTQEKTTLEEAINIFKTTYKQLYDLSISIDTGLINDVNAKLTINELSSKTQTTFNNFSTIFNSQVATSFINIKLKLNDLCSAVNKLINPSTSIPFTSQIKETYCKCIFLLQDLSANINNL